LENVVDALHVLMDVLEIMFTVRN